MLTKNEQALVRCGVKLFNAMERCVKWTGTGGTRQTQAYAAKEAALKEWNELIDKIEKENS